MLKGKQAMPIQEDETALVVWALWRHYYRYRDIEFIRPLWVDVVQKAADFMVPLPRSRAPGLPLPSYDLWEERWGVHAFTVATVYGGLKAAQNFAVCFGDRAKAEIVQQGRRGDQGRRGEVSFSDKLEPLRPPAGAAGQSQAAGRSRTTRRRSPLHAEPTASKTSYEVDEMLDASLYAIFKFHLFEADDPRVVSTMKAVEEKLWVKTRVGGVARYENDYYHRVSNDIASRAGQPVVHLHALAGRLLHHPRQDRRPS